MAIRLLREPSFIVGAANLLLLLVLLWSVGKTNHSASAAASSEDATLIQDDESQPAESRLYTKSDAENEVSSLGKSPKARELAAVIARVNDWVADRDEQAELDAFRSQQMERLRSLITTELSALHTRALNAPDSNQATKLHDEAGQLLALYPLEANPKVLGEARALSSRHVIVRARVEAIQRQRYNFWAMTRIEAAITAVNEIATSFKKVDNPKTIEAVVEKLGEVDPMLLEPIVAQFYNHAVEHAKSNINSEQQFILAKRLVDPKIRRKGYGDF